MLIKLVDETYSESTTKEIRELFPNLKIMSKSEFENGDFRSSYITLWKYILAIGAAISLVFGLIIIFLNRNYIKNRNKELAILFSLGYSKKEIYKILIYEYFMTNIMNYLGAYAIIALLNVFFLQYTKYFEIIGNAFTLSVFGLGAVFVMFMTLLSIVFSMRGIKQNNLQKYLR